LIDRADRPANEEGSAMKNGLPRRSRRATRERPPEAGAARAIGALRAAWVATALLFVGASAAPAAETVKPLRIVAGYHQVGATYFMLQARSGRFHQLCYRRGQEQKSTLDARDLDDYSVVILAPGGKLQYAEEGADPAALAGEYVANGGRLVLVGRNAAKLLPALDPNVRKHVVLLPGQRRQVRVGDNSHPLFAGLQLDLEVGDVVEADADAESVLTSPEGTCAHVKNVGKGKLVYLSEALFPPFGQDPLKPRQLERRPELDAFVDRLFDFLDVPASGDAVSLHLRQTGNARPVSFWFREPDLHPFEGAEHLTPPAPGKDELLSEISLDLALDECERRLFYATVRDPCPRLSATVCELRTEGRKPFPPANARLLLLEKPSPDFVGPNVYLGALEDLHPLGEPFVAVDRPRTLTWCLRVRSHGLAPGEYGAAIVFRNGDQVLGRLPLALRVWPVALSRRFMDFDVEIFNPVTELNRQPQARRNLERRIRDWQEHGVNIVLGGTSQWGKPHGFLRETGQPLLEAVAATPERFRSNAGPRLDMGPEIDAFFELVAGSGLHKFRTYHLSGPKLETFAAAARQIHGAEVLTIDSPETAAFASYWFTEFAACIREKGFTELSTKIGDEWGPDFLDSFIRQAQIARAAGWRVVGNPNLPGVLDTVQRRRRVWGLIDQWWYAYNPAFLHAARLMAQRGQPPPQDGLWGCLTSSWWWNLAPRRTLAYAWSLGYHDFSGLHWHGWSRNTINSMGVWLVKREGVEYIYPSLGYEFLAEGVEDAQYVRQLRELTGCARTDHSRPIPMTAPTPLQGLFGADAILPLTDKTYSIYTMPEASRDAPFAAYPKAKRELLRRLQEISAARDERVRASWNGIELVRDSAPQVTIGCGEQQKAALALRDAVARRTGVALRVDRVAEAAAGKTPLCLVGTRDEELLKALRSSSPNGPVSDRYPREGGYVIIGATASGGPVLTVCGGDASGLLKGVRSLGLAVTVERNVK